MNSKLSKNIQNILALGLFVGLIILIVLKTTDNPRYDLIFMDSKLLIEGFVNTIYISLITLVCSMISGFILYIMQKSSIQFIKAVAVIFRELIMGTPLLVMIFLGVYVLGDVINTDNKMVLGLISLTLYMSPYISNAYDSAIKIVNDDQYIVMDLYGFNPIQKYRYVIFPQMIRPLMPQMINNLSSIIKGSALLKIVSISEISYVITVISSKNWASIEGYLVMWMAYLIITIPLSILAQYIGRRLEV